MACSMQLQIVAIFTGSVKNNVAPGLKFDISFLKKYEEKRKFMGVVAEAG